MSTIDRLDCSKSVDLIRKLRLFLPGPCLVQIYKSFVKPYLDYNDIICKSIRGFKTIRGFFQNEFESIQYNAALAITGVITGTSREKIYSELDLGSLQNTRWYR